MASPDAAWENAVLAAGLFAVDPAGLGGVSLRASAGPVRDRWLALLRGVLPPETPLRRVPCHVEDSRLLGGLDLPATLQAGRPVVERGILAEADGGVVLLAMAERLSSHMAGRLAGVLDHGTVRLERDGFARTLPARVGMVALDEGADEDEATPEALLDRFAFHVDLGGIAAGVTERTEIPADDIAAARDLLPQVAATDDVLEALCGTAQALGIASIRAPLLALRAAHAAASLAGRTEVIEDDATLAARLVFSSRATAMPPAEPPQPPPPEPEPPAESPPDDSPQGEDRPLDDVILEAVRAAIPDHLLERLQAEAASRTKSASGRGGAEQSAKTHGRPAGTRRATPAPGLRLNLIETLRAAAPWQKLRRREGDTDLSRIRVMRDDFRITRLKQRSRTTTIFVVDASGSSASERLAEAKGAVELLLADCYVRRDEVALLAFRGKDAELLLPPTRSLVRAKRSLAGLPGGGGTPLAAGIDAAAALADAIRRRGGTPALVILTDGRANIARGGAAGRAAAEADALDAARSIRGASFKALVIDTSARPEPAARRLADAMAAPYLPLPRADAGAISRSIRAAQAPSLRP
ncbi:magnesium chelatase subunit D [Skermanella aerolata]|uniref:magnesium chelatase subunit D n=1 Tax=Skermanella aerolata TaxID=393310 RepID=UPI003D1E9CEA